MKRKVGSAGKLRLSPNEEAFILKEDYERRRKLRLLQVREQERGIAFQIREDVKQRRSRQLTRLAEELRAEWEDAQSQKVESLEKLYLATLRHIGEGHREAKENEPDLDAVALRAAERKRKAEMRHNEALKVQKNQKEMLMKQKTRHIKARKEALLVEKERSAKMTRLPPPVPAPFENIEVNRLSSLKTNSSTYHHLSTFVSRQMDTKQPDAHLAAEEEGRRLEELQKQAALQRLEQWEKAHVRGSRAIRKIHLTQNQERLMEELEQLQKEDLARRRQTVAQMPPQLVEHAYKRSEMKEDWQRELEFAFEDVYSADRKVRGNLILHLEPEPLPSMTDQLQDEELDLSMEQETENPQVPAAEILRSSETDVVDSDMLTIESGSLSSEDKPFSCQEAPGKEQAMTASPPVTAVIPNSVHPQEEAVRVRMSARHKQIMEIEEQKQKQLELLEQIEQQKLRLETDCLWAQLEEERRRKIQQTETGPPLALRTVISDEDSHREMIHNYQQQLLHQNRLHKQSVETAKKKLLDFQTLLKERYPSMSATSLISDSIVSAPNQKSKIPIPVSEHWNKPQRLKLSPGRHQAVQSKPSPRLDPGHIQVPRQAHFPQVEMLGTSDVLAKESLESQEHLQQFSQVETHQRDSQLVLKDSDPLLRTLSYYRPQMLQDARKMSEVLKATTVQTLDPQQVSPEDTEIRFSQPAEISSFFPLVSERSTSLPVKAEFGKVLEPFSAISKSAVSESQSVISQMHDQYMPSQTIRAQQGHLKILQEQLELQKEVLQVRQEAQKELEMQAGFPAFLPVAAGRLFASLPSAKAESRRIQESSLVKSDATVSSGSVDRLWGFSQPVSSQQNNLEFLQEQSSIQRDNQARRQAQEVLFAHKRSELDRSICFEQAGPSLPHQEVSQPPFTSLSFAERQCQEQPLPTSEKGLVSSQSEISRSQDGPSSFLQQFLPLQYSLKLLQDRLTTQRDMFLARHSAQMELLLRRQRDLTDSKSWPLFSPVVAQHSDATQAVTAAEPRRFQQLCSSEETVVPSSNLVIPALQDQSLGFPQHSQPRQEHVTTLQEQSHIQRVIFDARKEAQELEHKQSELEKEPFSQQMGTSPSPSQTTKWERFQESMTVKSDSTYPRSHLKTLSSQERLVRFSQHVFPLQDNPQEHQNQADTEKDALQCTPQTQENPPSQQTGLSSSIPSLVDPSPMSWPSANSGTNQELLSTEHDSKVTSRHLQIPELHGRLLKITQLIQPQQNSLKALEEKLNAQREAIIQSLQEAHEESLLHKQKGWKGRMSPEQADTASPLRAQHSSTSLPLSESERTQELYSVNSDNMISSNHSEMLVLPERVLDLSHPGPPQQDNVLVLPQHLHAQANSFPSTGKAQKESVLLRPHTFEEEVLAEHFTHLHLGDLKALQQQLHMQKKAIRAGQETQEELLWQRLSQLEQRVSSEQISSSLFSSRVVLPIANSEATLTSSPSRSDDTEVSTSHGKLRNFSQPLLPQQDNLTRQLDLEMVFPKELLLQKQNTLYKSKSSEHVLPSFLSKELGHSFLPLPFTEAKSKSICELYLSKNKHADPPSDSEISGLQGTLLSYLQRSLTQQDNSSLQKQLDLQRGVLHSRQQAQEDEPTQRRTAVQQQIQRCHETLQDFSNGSQTRKSTVENDLKMQKMEQLRGWLPHIPDVALNGQESTSLTERRSTGGALPVSADIIGEDQELGRRASKPPISKVKCGLDLNQHELSTIQEVESPASGRASMPGKPDFYQERDSLRVSVSREQSFLGSPLARDPSSYRHSPPQENTRPLLERHDHDGAVKVKEFNIEDHEVLSHAVSEEDGCAYLRTIMKPDDKAEIQESSQEPLSSITVSTGSFLSYENTDLSLTDPESFSEQIDHQEQESTTSKQEEADPLNSASPATQVSQQQQNSSNACGSMLPPGEGRTSDHTHFEQLIGREISEAKLIPERRDLQVPTVDLDFPELEHIFPNLHRQLFKPLEPHLDFDLSSSSGISQDNRDFYQSSHSSEKHHVSASSTSRVAFTALRRTSLQSLLNTKPSQESDFNPVHAADQSFVTEITADGSEQSFQQLPPEFSSKESQHADLPSIYSTEARGTSRGMEDENYPEVLQNKKSVRVQLFTENLSSVGSSDGDQLHGQHSTPCGSFSSECSVKELENNELSRTPVTMLQSQRITENDTAACSIDPCAEEIPTVEMGTSLQPSHSLSIQNTKSFQNSVKTETPRALRNLSQLTQPDPVECSQLFSLQSSIPVWETESGHGIMEEPELTLVSISDISIAETDFANLTLEENEAKHCFQAGEFLPLPSETSAAAELSMEQFTMVTPTLTPSSLQEPCVKRKKERSHQRLKEMCSKTQLPQTKTAKEKPCTGSFLSRLKGVRALLPEERKTAQALRLYNQLAEVEVKQQREEKAYAQNRARAKQFHKVSRTPTQLLTHPKASTPTTKLHFIPFTENTRETSSQKYMLTPYKKFVCVCV